MKLKLLSLFLFVGTYVMAQSLTIERIDTTGDLQTQGYTYAPDANKTKELIAYLDIKNNSNKTIDVLAKRIDKNYNGLTDSNAICWGGQCWSPDVSVSPFPTTLAAGQTSVPAEFSAHVYPDGDGKAWRGPITYVFYDMNNPSDSVAYTINYQVGTVLSLRDQAFDEFAVYPNPASNILNVKYSGMRGEAASFELVSMVGTKVYSRQLTKSDDQLKLDVSKLSRGVYFYIIKSNGEVASSKKLVIK